MTTKRNREALEKMTPEERAALEAILAKNRTPQHRAEIERVREKIREEIPPATADPDLLELLASLRAERERQGLSLGDIEARTGIARANLSNLENGKVHNPTWTTLRLYSKAICAPIQWTIQASPVVPLPRRFSIERDDTGMAIISVPSEECADLVAHLRNGGVVCTQRKRVSADAEHEMIGIALGADEDLRRIRGMVNRWYSTRRNDASRLATE
jgi:transcriptional regulator with XRE-family HTH domain